MVLENTGRGISEKKFISRLNVPDKSLLSVMFFLSEQKEYRNATVESKIISCYQEGCDYFYLIEFSYNMPENDIIRTIKNMI
jgi:hypothetical protein